MEARCLNVTQCERVGTWQDQVSAAPVKHSRSQGTGLGSVMRTALASWGPLLLPGRIPPQPPETGARIHTWLHPNQLTSATGTRASASCPMRSFPWSQDNSIRPRATSRSTETRMLAFLKGGFQQEWVVRVAWPERVSTYGSSAEMGVGKVLGLWGI